MNGVYVPLYYHLSVVCYQFHACFNSRATRKYPENMLIPNANTSRSRAKLEGHSRKDGTSLVLSGLQFLPQALPCATLHA